MPAKNKPITAGELMQQLEADHDWVRQRDAREEDRLRQQQQSQQEQATLLLDLETVGTDVKSVWDLVNIAKPYPKALPVLLAHLLRPYSDRTREGIARALAVKEARPIAWDELIRIARTGSPQAWVSDGVMVAISAMAHPGDLDALVSLITDRSIGPGRVFLIRNLMRSKKQQARQVLLDLRDDPDLHNEIAARLKAANPS